MSVQQGLIAAQRRIAELEAERDKLKARLTELGNPDMVADRDVVGNNPLLFVQGYETACRDYAIACRAAALSLPPHRGSSMSNLRTRLDDAKAAVVRLRVDTAAVFRAGIAELEAERDRLKAALDNIARQFTTAEHEALGDEDGDVEGAYDTIIGIARAALLSPSPSGE
jgi:cell division protein FtsB